MKISHLKEKVILKIQQESDESVIAEILVLLDIEEDLRTVYVLNNEQKSAVEEAQHQYRNGQYKSDSDAQKHFDKWRKK